MPCSIHPFIISIENTIHITIQIFFMSTYWTNVSRKILKIVYIPIYFGAKLKSLKLRKLCIYFVESVWIISFKNFLISFFVG